MRLFRFIASIGFLLNLVISAEGNTLHLVVATDNWAPRIGEGCLRDGEAIIELFKSELGDDHDVRTYIVKPDAMTPQGIIAKINSITVRSGDAVCFYYSGHGEMEVTPTEKRHVLRLSGVSSAALSRSKVREALRRIGERGGNPRVTLLLTECCYKVPVAVGGAAPGNIEPKLLLPYLFFEQTDVQFVDINSCSPGQFAIQHGHDGNYSGLFTHAFIDVCHGSRGEILAWREVFLKCRETTSTYFEFSRGRGRRDAGPGLGPIDHDTGQDTQTPYLFEPREILEKEDTMRLGVVFASDKSLKIRKIVPNTSAAISLLQEGDTIVRAMTPNGMVAIESQQQFLSIVNASRRSFAVEVSRPKEDGTGKMEVEIPIEFSY